MRARTAILAAALAIFQGCACDTVPSDALESCDASEVFAGRVATDILFVIDDSGSMQNNQSDLRDALTSFIGTLAASPVADDFQIGVTTTSVAAYDGQTVYPNTPSPAPDGTPYARGVVTAIDPAVDPDLSLFDTWGDFLWTPDPGAPDPGFYGPRILRWDSPNLQSDFRRNVLVGRFGAGREQPLEAMRLALSDALLAPGAENEGFLRPGARLAVIFLTDEDDCSGPTDLANVTSDATCRAARTVPGRLTAVADYVAFLQGAVGGEVREIVVAAIAGVTCVGTACSNQLCPSAITEPTRILELLSAFPPERTRLASICTGAFDAALTDFALAILSQTMPLDGAVADYRMLVATVTKPSGQVACRIVPADAPLADRNTADAVYRPPQGGAPASLTFQNACALEPGDRIDVKVVCAG